MSKYFFRKSEDWDFAEMCYTLQYHKDYMREHDIKEMQVYEAKRETSNLYFYCNHFGEIGESNDTCGKGCDLYKPRNGKSGVCIHHRNCYEQTSIVKTLRI